MKGDPPLKDQFVFPTMMQDHGSRKWKTTIGMRNLTLIGGMVFSEMCGNPEIMKLDKDGNYPNAKELSQFAIVNAKTFLNEVEKHFE